MVASLSDLAQGDKRGPEAGHGAGTAGAGRNSARGCSTKGAGAVATENNRETACCNWNKKSNFIILFLHKNIITPSYRINASM